ncbi:MAG: hypothetical protein QME79_15035, partial [Bacillota bacterium]|nr:hypothetical protein [Bacillota bacterium]
EFVRNSVPVDQIGGKERDIVSAIVSFMDGAAGRLICRDPAGASRAQVVILHLIEPRWGKGREEYL